MNDLFQPVRDFETRMADYTGFNYGVAVESCSAALFLCCLYKQVARQNAIEIPANTYVSVPAGINNAGGRVKFYHDDGAWQETGYYQLGNTGIWDCARYLERGMGDTFRSKDLICVSFHRRKALPIGRGGMVLTYDKEAVEWLTCMRHDGRHDKTPEREDEITVVGWNFLLTPEQASRGIGLMGNLKDKNPIEFQEYPDQSQWKMWRR